MLYALDPDDTPSRAYPVPWRVDRIHESHPLVTNASDTALDFVRVFIDTARTPAMTESWGQMMPGETAELCLCEVDPDNAVVTVAWFLPDTGTEYIWRFVM